MLICWSHWRPGADEFDLDRFAIPLVRAHHGYLDLARLEEGVMAWVEQVGRCSWRVRYRTKSGGCGSVAGFASHSAAQEYIQDLRTDQRRRTWLDPAGPKLRPVEWIDRWIDTIDVETRTEENYRRCLRLHILPRWGG